MESARCRHCGSVWAGDVRRCGSCGSHELDAHVLAGTARVVASTEVRSGSTRPVPFVVVMVETAEGTREFGISDAILQAGTAVVLEDGGDDLPAVVAARSADEVPR